MPASRVARFTKIALPAVLIAWLSLALWNSAKPLPPGMHIASPVARLAESDVDFLYDAPQRHDVGARGTAAIDHAEEMIVIDRSPLDPELAQHLLARKRVRPNLKIVLVTDPANQAYGGSAPQTLASLEAAGIIVARVRLDRLRDSNPLYSGWWRLLFGWWSDPFEEAPGRITPAAWARVRNAKADQRQLVVADDGSGGWLAVVSPAGSGVGAGRAGAGAGTGDAGACVVLRGSLARAMIAGELEVAAWSTDDDRLPAAPQMTARGVGSIDARYLTEGAIESALLDAIAAAGRDDEISIAVENFSRRRLIAAALGAAARGAHLQVLLARNLMPNQAVAGELKEGGGGHIDVRWYAAAPGAAYPRLLIVRHRADLWVNFGSANFTRRNLEDFNLESGVELRMPTWAAPARVATQYFSGLWSGASDAQLTDEPAAYWRYRIAEATGLSSF